MNIQSNLRKFYNTIKSLQIEEKDITPENFSRASYMAGMLDSAKIFINLYNGEMTEDRLKFEIDQLKGIYN